MKNLINKIHNADCLEFLKQIQDNSIDLILSDPPYKMEAQGGGIASKRSIYKEMQQYTNMSNNWFSEQFLSFLIRKCKYPNLFIFCSSRDKYEAIEYARKQKFLYYELPLCKKNPMPFVNNTWLTNEWAVHITDRQIVKTKDYHVKLPYFLTGNEKTTNHPNEKNLKDIKKILLNLTSPNELVLDCFSGSGSVAVACAELNRRFISIEINPRYYFESLKRLDESTAQKDLFYKAPFENKQINFLDDTGQ